MQNTHTSKKANDRLEPGAHAALRTVLDKALSLVLSAALVLTMSPLGDAYAAGAVTPASPSSSTDGAGGGGFLAG